MKIELKHFNLIDGAVMFARLPAIEQEVYSLLSGFDFDAQEATAAIHQSPGIHFTLMIEGEVIAVAGFIRQRNGVLRSWFAAPESSWERFGAQITEESAATLKRLLDEGHAHRIETVTLARHTRAREWYERIGLRLESTMVGYCADGSDAVMYTALAEKK